MMMTNNERLTADQLKKHVKGLDLAPSGRSYDKRSAALSVSSAELRVAIDQILAIKDDHVDLRIGLVYGLFSSHTGPALHDWLDAKDTISDHEELRSVTSDIVVNLRRSVETVVDLPLSDDLRSDVSGALPEVIRVTWRAHRTENDDLCEFVARENLLVLLMENARLAKKLNPWIWHLKMPYLVTLAAHNTLVAVVRELEGASDLTDVTEINGAHPLRPDLLALLAERFEGTVWKLRSYAQPFSIVGALMDRAVANGMSTIRATDCLRALSGTTKDLHLVYQEVLDLAVEFEDTPAEWLTSYLG